MASNPPFQVEDQTDEDFFDKLVDDDFDGPTESASKFAEGSDSDDARVFSNLSMGDVGNAIEDSVGEGEPDTKGEKGLVGVEPALVSDSAEEKNTLVSSNSNGCDSLMESSNDGVGSEFTTESSACKSNGSTDVGIKEVGWSSFYADTKENGGQEFGSYSDFFNDLGVDNGSFPATIGGDLSGGAEIISGNEIYKSGDSNNSFSYEQYQGNEVQGASVDQSTSTQDLSSNQYWENLYPGWKYDPITGQWYQVENSDAIANVQASSGINSTTDWAAVSESKSELSYMQQSVQSPVGTITKTTVTESVFKSAQVAHGSNGYPEHMVFDPLYPGWYYDTIAQEWRTLESYNSSAQAYDQRDQKVADVTGSYVNDNSLYGDYGQNNNFGSQGISHSGQDDSWVRSCDNQNQPSFSNWQTKSLASQAAATLGGNQLLDNSYRSNETVSMDQGKSVGSFGAVPSYHQQSQGHRNVNASVDNQNQQSLSSWQTKSLASQAVTTVGGNQLLDNSYGSNLTVSKDQGNSVGSFGAVPSYYQPSQGHRNVNGSVDLQDFAESGSYSQPFTPANFNDNKQLSSTNDYYGSQQTVINSQFQGDHQSSYNPSVGRSSAGRPAHALVTFGFGGKLIIMKDDSSFGNLSYGNQDPVGGPISVLNLMEVVARKSDDSSIGFSKCNYFHALGPRAFPSPLVGGSVGNKEVNRWIDERISECESSRMDYRKGNLLRLLHNLLKIACQHYGKLRSPFGAETALRENDNPESALAKLFASAKRNGAYSNGYDTLGRCLQFIPSEGQLQAIASEVQNLLVSGRKKEALQCAQEGRLWGPALVLASQLGDQFYVDTVKQMAVHQLIPGSPLRTLCLLIAGQPADVFSTDNSLQGAVNMAQNPSQFTTSSMLDDWEENLAVITANRTKDDELVIIHLGDCLWKERSEIAAAHICYLVAEANFESYSDGARLCLIGTDHWRSPRTYASPEAIQRTEVYEYSKVLGNSQFVLLPFQPYKLVYAHMLAEVGKVSESLKYCQSVLKSLKAGRSPEVETLKLLVSSLEERIRTHQQGGYATNLAPAKLVGKLLNFFDSTAHRVVGGLPPPAPGMSHGNVQGIEHHQQQLGPRVSTSQSTMAMSSLMPSSSMEPINQWTPDRMAMSNRSVSEPDFGRTPRQVNSSKETPLANGQSKASETGRRYRFSRLGFGSQLLQKTVELVRGSRPDDKQAKLGEANKFYYDEKLKRWVEEGAEPPAEEAALPPPPTTAAFQNGTYDYNLKSALKMEALPPNGKDTSPGFPPIPPSSNQFSAHSRMGVRSRYVDTFNQGSGKTANLFQAPSIPSIKPTLSAKATFFVPGPALSSEPTVEAPHESSQDTTPDDHYHLSPSSTINSFKSPSPSSSYTSLQRFPSVGNIPSKGAMQKDKLISSNSRRTASWSGSFNGALSPPANNMGEVRALESMVMSPPSSFTSSDPSSTPGPDRMSSGGYGEDLHEVEL